MATVRELVTRLGFNVDNSGLNKYEKGTERVKQNANDAAASFRNMFAAFAGIAAIRSIAGIADSMQSLEARIGMLPQTVGDAGSAFDAVAKRASNANQSIDAYGSFYVKAGNATQDFIKDQSELLKVVDGAAFGLAASGATAANQSQAFFQLGQAIGSPVVQMEEMNTLIDVAPDLFRALGKAIPGADGNLKKFISTGKVTGKMLAEGLASVADDFEAKMKKIPLTIGQATTLIGNKWASFIAKFNRETMIVTKVANFIVGAMDKISAGLDSFTEFVGGSENALKLLMITAGALFAMMIPGWIAAAAATLAATWPLLAIIAALVFVGLLFEDFMGWLAGSDSLLGDFIGGVENFKTQIDNVKSAFDGVVSIASFLWNNVLKHLLGFSWFVFIQGLDYIAAVFRAVLTTVSAIVSAFRAVGNFIGGSDVAAAMQGPGAKVSPGSFGGLATGGGMQTNNQNVTVNVPPGTSAQTMEAARQGAMAGLNEGPQFFSGQIGQAL